MANWWEREPFQTPDRSGAETGGPATIQPTRIATAWQSLQKADWRGLIPIGALIILVVAVRGMDMWRERQLNSQRSREALRQVIAQEVEQRTTGDVEGYLMLLDPQADPSWRQHQVESLTALPLPVTGSELPVIERWEFRDGAAMVELWFPGPPASRETRFYRLVDDEWRRTPPLVTFWGGRVEADAPGVHFVFREADAAAVRQAAEALTTAYQQGKQRALSGPRLTVSIVPESAIEYDGRTNRLTLPSPRLTALPADVPPGGPLLWLLAHPVADQLADPGDAARYHYLDSAQLLQDHLRYWSLRWLAPFPKRWQRQMEESLRIAQEDGTLVSPRTVNLYAASRAQAYLAYYAAMTMADYIAETYGPQGLLRLERTLTRTSSWERAFPVALGVRIGDFEREWREYLASVLRSQ